MKFDLHTHAKWSKGAEFSLDYYLGMMQAAKRAGLDALALTEHFDTRHFSEMMYALDRRCSYEHDYYGLEGVRVFPGIEVDIAEGGHILLVGGRSAILDIRIRLEPYTRPGSFIGLAQLLDWADGHHCLKIGAHPFREENPLHAVPAALLARLDALDLNGRDLHRAGRPMVRAVTELGRSIGLPVIAGSDTHAPPQFGCVYNELADGAAPPATIEELRALIRSRAYRYVLSPDLDLLVQEAERLQGLYKKNA